MVVPPVAFVWSWNADLRTVTVNGMIGKTSAVIIVVASGFAYKLNTLFFFSSSFVVASHEAACCVLQHFSKKDRRQEHPQAFLEYVQISRMHSKNPRRHGVSARRPIWC